MNKRDLVRVLDRYVWEIHCGNMKGPVLQFFGKMSLYGGEMGHFWDDHDILSVIKDADHRKTLVAQGLVDEIKDVAVEPPVPEVDWDELKEMVRDWRELRKKLTEEEKAFLHALYQELTLLKAGPAHSWCQRNDVPLADLLFMLWQFKKEHPDQSNPQFENYSEPWQGKYGLHYRSVELQNGFGQSR